MKTFKSTFSFFLLIYLILFWGCKSKPDPGVIRGTVQDLEGKPANKIIIICDKTSLRTLTNDEGEYELSGVPSGKIRIIALDRLKYDDRIIDTSLSQDEGLLLNFQVSPSSIQTIEWCRVTPGKIFINALYATIEDSLEYNTYISKYEITNSLFRDFLNNALRLGDIKVKNRPDDFSYVFDSRGNKILTLGRTLNELSKYPYSSYPNITLMVRRATSEIYFDKSKFVVYNGYENHLVRSLTFNGAKFFADFYGFRLPNYKEWWRAAFGDSRNYWNDKITGEYINYAGSNDPYERGTYSTPVGFFNGKIKNIELDNGRDEMIAFETKDAKSPFGLYDVLGNVREYIYDAQDEPNAVGYSYEDFISSLSAPMAAEFLAKSVRSDQYYSFCGFRIVIDTLSEE